MKLACVLTIVLLVSAPQGRCDPAGSPDAELEKIAAPHRERGRKALDELLKPDFAKRPLAERNKVVQDAAAGAGWVVPTLDDAAQAMRYASALITHGTLRYVNAIEYWGEDAKAREALAPIATAVDAILQRAEVLADRKASELLSKVKGENDEANIARWRAADNLHSTIVFLWANATYGLAMSYEPSDPKRNTVCQRAIAQLKEYDVDGAEIRPSVQLIIAKLYMVRGAPSDYASAKAYFNKVLDGTAAKPKQYANEQYSARYFAIVLDVMNHHLNEADAAVEALKTWQAANLPGDKATRDGAMAAELMLRWRKEARSLAAASPDEKKKLHAEAVQILVDLADRRPDLRTLIKEKVGPGVLDADDVIGVGSGGPAGSGKK